MAFFNVPPHLMSDLLQRIVRIVIPSTALMAVRATGSSSGSSTGSSSSSSGSSSSGASGGGGVPGAVYAGGGSSSAASQQQRPELLLHSEGGTRWLRGADGAPGCCCVCFYCCRERRDRSVPCVRCVLLASSVCALFACFRSSSFLPVCFLSSLRNASQFFPCLSEEEFVIDESVDRAPRLQRFIRKEGDAYIVSVRGRLGRGGDGWIPALTELNYEEVCKYQPKLNRTRRRVVCRGFARTCQGFARVVPPRSAGLQPALPRSDGRDPQDTTSRTDLVFAVCAVCAVCCNASLLTAVGQCQHGERGARAEPERRHTPLQPDL